VEEFLPQPTAGKKRITIVPGEAPIHRIVLLPEVPHEVVITRIAIGITVMLIETVHLKIRSGPDRMILQHLPEVMTVEVVAEALPVQRGHRRLAVAGAEHGLNFKNLFYV
jgi:hypothetical protein